MSKANSLFPLDKIDVIMWFSIIHFLYKHSFSKTQKNSQERNDHGIAELPVFS